MFRNGHIVVFNIGKNCSWDRSPNQRSTILYFSYLTVDQELSISEIGKRLTQAGRLKTRPLCVYGSQEIPEGVTPSTSVSSCVARAIFTLATRQETPHS